MEHKKPGKEKIIAWAGLALGALALFLVVYSQWLGPEMEKANAEREVQIAAKIEESKAKQKQEDRVDWTYEDYANAMREMVIDKVINGTYRGGGSYMEEMIASLKFDRVYVTGLEQSNRVNGLSIVVCYTSRDEGYTLHYDITNAAVFRGSFDTVGDFADYWIEHQDFLEYSYGSYIGQDPDSTLEEMADGCFALFTAEDFAEFYGGEE